MSHSPPHGDGSGIYLGMGSEADGVQPARRPFGHWTPASGQKWVLPIEGSQRV